MLLSRLPRVLGEKELRTMGLQVARGLAERGVVHLLRDLIVTPEAKTGRRDGHRLSPLHSLHPFRI
jgi:hypothetical protein